MTKVRIYTDGSSSKNHAEGPGGYAAIMFADGVPVEGVFGGDQPATNNQMELRGLIAGLEMIPLIECFNCKRCGIVQDCLKEGDCAAKKKIMRPLYEDLVIYSDSKYCVNGATDWVHSWHMNGWRTYQKKPVKNRELWEVVRALMLRTGATVKWVKGHSGNMGNELADAYAFEGKKRTRSNNRTSHWEDAIDLSNTGNG